jgi:hypothetical protein
MQTYRFQNVSAGKKWDFDFPKPDSLRTASTLLGSILFALLSTTLFFANTALSSSSQLSKKD